MLIQKFNYAPINRETVDGSRLYKLPDGSNVPSVTTILDATKSEEKKQALQNWKRRVGHQKAQEISTEASSRGTRMHTYLENYVKTGALKEPGSNPFSKQSHGMAQVIINEGLKHVGEIWGIEVPVYYSGLYAGTVDNVGVWQGTEAIIDFKQTNKPKKREWIDDYFIQTCAYAAAHNEMFKTNIKTGVILMCSANMEFQKFVVDGSEFTYYTNKWWDRVEEYFRNK